MPGGQWVGKVWAACFPESYSSGTPTTCLQGGSGDGGERARPRHAACTISVAGGDRSGSLGSDQRLIARSGRRIRCRPLTADQRGSKVAYVDARSAALLSALLSTGPLPYRRAPQARTAPQLSAVRGLVVKQIDKQGLLLARHRMGPTAHLVETGGAALATHTARCCGGGSRAAMLRLWSTPRAVWR